MVKKAKEEQKSVLDIAAYYTDRFFDDFNLVNNKVPEIVSHASNNIDTYIKIIDTLIKRICL